MTELSLLVIDLGDSCVVKVEKGQLPADTVSMALPDEIRDLLGYVDDLKTGYCMVSDKSFTELRKAIDGAEGSNPVPRIEQDNADQKGSYVLYEDADTKEYIAKDTYDALCELAGHPLPVYEPKRGKWTQLIPFTLNDMYNGGNPLYSTQIDGGTGVKMWRYERGE